MLDIDRLLMHGLILSALESLLVFIGLTANPRLFLQDYPKTIQDRVAPKTHSEQRLSRGIAVVFMGLLMAVPFLSTWGLMQQLHGHIAFLALFLNAFGVAFIFNVTDLLILDWLLVCKITPAFLVLPGTEGVADYKDYSYHLRGFLAGTIFSAVLGALVAALVYFLGRLV